MANRCWFRTLSRHLQSTKTLSPLSQAITISTNALYQTPSRRTIHYFSNNSSNICLRPVLLTRRFCSKYSDDDDEEDDEEEGESDGEEDVESEDESDLSPEERVKAAAEIGYTVVGSLQESDQVFKPYEPVFAVIQLGSHQFKVSNDDVLYVEKLKYCDINDKLVLSKVLLLGSATQTIIGRPILPDAAVHAVVEEHALAAKVIIFKKKRRKNYRRKNGHRQELTKIRITDILGIEKPKQQPEPISLKTEEPISPMTEKIENLKEAVEA